MEKPVTKKMKAEIAAKNKAAEEEYYRNKVNAPLDGAVVDKIVQIVKAALEEQPKYKEYATNWASKPMPAPMEGPWNYDDYNLIQLEAEYYVETIDSGYEISHPRYAGWGWVSPQQPKRVCWEVRGTDKIEYPQCHLIADGMLAKRHIEEYNKCQQRAKEYLALAQMSKDVFIEHILDNDTKVTQMIREAIRPLKEADKPLAIQNAKRQVREQLA